MTPFQSAQAALCVSVLLPCLLHDMLPVKALLCLSSNKPTEEDRDDDG